MSDFDARQQDSRLLNDLFRGLVAISLSMGQWEYAAEGDKNTTEENEEESTEQHLREQIWGSGLEKVEDLPRVSDLGARPSVFETTLTFRDLAGLGAMKRRAFLPTQCRYNYHSGCAGLFLRRHCLRGLLTTLEQSIKCREAAREARDERRERRNESGPVQVTVSAAGVPCTIVIRGSCDWRVLLKESETGLVTSVQPRQLWPEPAEPQFGPCQARCHTLPTSYLQASPVHQAAGMHMLESAHGQ